MSNLKTTTIAEISVTYWEGRLPDVGEYGILNGKIYRIWSRSGCGKDSTYGLENVDGKIYYKPWKNQDKFHKIIKPTGYIDI